MQWWNEKFVNRRDYILDHLNELTLNSEETLAVLLIDFLNQHNMLISHAVLADKMKKSSEQIDDLLSSLTAKGYLELSFVNNKLTFSIDGVFAGEEDKVIAFDESIFDKFESEFGRPLTQIELQRLSNWIHEYDQKLIVYALREAITYDHIGFDYIERILIEWKKRNFTSDDYEEGNR